MPKPFTTVTADRLKKSLARKFIPLGDSLRDLLTQFGLRQYSVRLVRIRWSEGRRGVGTPITISDEDLLPTPKVVGLDSMNEVNQSIGLNENGSIELQGISGRYTEDQLWGKSDPLKELPQDEEIFYEVVFFQPGSDQPVRRRFYPKSAPTYKAGSLSWTIRLERSGQDREENGDYP